MDRISVRELLNLNNPIIVDVRNSYYYNISHIKGSISIPYYNLLNNYSHYLNKYSTYYLYCDTGEQSSKIVNRLNNFGYHTVSVDGGFLEYQRLYGNIG